MRCKLFVPGARPEPFSKAVVSAADALSVGLEDSVPMIRRAEARENLPPCLCHRTAGAGID